MGELSEISPSKVRDLIFAYERQSSYKEVPESGPVARQRAKSIGNVLSYKQFRQPNLEIHNVLDIEKELVKIEAHLNYYEVYEKETHVAFQEQLFSILTSIVSIDPEGHESTIQKKKDLIGDTSKLARILNSKLPVEGTHAYKVSKKTYSNLIRRDEAVVSTTSRSREIKTVNGGFKSEESLNSNRDSVDFSVSSKQEDTSTVDLNSPESTSPVPEKTEVPPVDSGFLPSVSRLKKFFSFKRDEKPEIRVTKASYSGLSRSQSLNLKSTTYVVTKKERVEKRNRNKEDSIVEDGAGENIEQNTLKTATDQPELYTEPVEEIEEYRETESDKLHISVSKLKSLFEDKQKEGEEGNYLNSPGIGILRNVDVKSKEISKSKSLSDLKLESFHYSYKDIDLSNEIDDDVITFSNQEHNSKEQPGAITYQEEEDDSGRQPESLTFSKVEILKKSFESFNNNNVSTTVHNHEERTPNLQTAEMSSGPESVLLEPPSQTMESSFEISQSNAGSTEVEEKEAKAVVVSGTVETLKHTFERLNSTTTVDTQETITKPEEESLNADVESRKEEVHLLESVQDLKKSFENLNRSISQEHVSETLRTIVVPASSQGFEVAVIQNYPDQNAVISTSTDHSDKNSYTVQLETPSLEVPTELKIETNTVKLDNHEVENGGPVVPISLYNGNQTADSSEISGQKFLARAVIENKSVTFMKILETPVAYSTTTTEPQTAVEEVNSTPIEDGQNLEHFKVTLSTSQENIIDEILNDGDTPNDIDDEFEKILQEVK